MVGEDLQQGCPSQPFGLRPLFGESNSNVTTICGVIVRLLTLHFPHFLSSRREVLPALALGGGTIPHAEQVPWELF